MWTGTLRKDGYGVLYVRQDGRWRQIRAHRYSYELLVGPIPEGAVLDHLCHSRSGCTERDRECLHRRCVRPDHLEPTGNYENVRRGAETQQLARYATHCKHGHLFDEANTAWTAEGWRRCKECHRQAANATYARKAGPIPEGRTRRRSDRSDRIGAHNRGKTHCPSGHPYSPENTRTPPSGGRYCRACERERGRQRLKR